MKDLISTRETHSELIRDVTSSCVQRELAESGISGFYWALTVHTAYRHCSTHSVLESLSIICGMTRTCATSGIWGYATKPHQTAITFSGSTSFSRVGKCQTRLSH